LKTVPKWIPTSSPLNKQRNRASFPSFPDPLQDPNANLTQWLEATQIIPISVVEWKCRKGWFAGPRTLSDSGCYCFTDGGGTVTLDSKTFSFQPGDLLLFPTGTRHCIRLSHGDDMRQLAMHFHAYVFGNIDLLDLVGFPFHIPHTSVVPFKSTLEKLNRIHALKPNGWSQMMAVDIMSMLMGFILHHGSLFRIHERNLVQRELPRLLPCLHQIEREIANPELSVTDLARTTSVSEVYLRKIFKQLTGLSPILFVQRRRIQTACKQLRTTQMSIKQIAEVSGFSDIAFFYRVFKHWIKMTPVEYRSAEAVAEEV
jgi:AraC family transcriptional regulator of arabinose operon